jgi:hypothetical protein
VGDPRFRNRGLNSVLCLSAGITTRSALFYGPMVLNLARFDRHIVLIVGYYCVITVIFLGTVSSLGICP